jgi:hypothetical protein
MFFVKYHLMSEASSLGSRTRRSYQLALLQVFIEIATIVIVAELALALPG